MATVEDHLRRLRELRTIYLGSSLGVTLPGQAVPTFWYEGRLEQSNDGTWIFRSSSSDGSIVAFTLGRLTDHQWSSEDLPREALTCFFKLKSPLLLTLTQS